MPEYPTRVRRAAVEHRQDRATENEGGVMDTTEPTGCTHWDDYPASAYEDFEESDGDNEDQARAAEA